MFSHVMVGSNDIERSRTFYDALFGAIGGKPGQSDDKGRLVYRHNGGTFMVSRPIDGGQASGGNGSTIGFLVDGSEQADAWEQAGAKAGGQSVEDPPGPRHGAKRSLYLAYLRDPDGNKLCALHPLPAE